MSSQAVTGASLLILLPSLIFGVSGLNLGYPMSAQQHGYVEVTAEDGTAFATSTLNDEHEAGEAFKIYGAYGRTAVYWCTEPNPAKPVYLWFQFKEPKRVTNITFEEYYELPQGEVYEVFASDAVGNCNNENGQTILFSGTADVFSAGVAFENKHPFSCYGLKAQSQSQAGYVAVRRLMFGINLKENVPLTLDGAQYFASSTRDSKHGPERAFLRETSDTWSWMSQRDDFPSDVYVRLPRPDTVAGFSFRSSLLGSYPYDYYNSPSKFEFVASNDSDCESWTVIAKVRVSPEWKKLDEKKSWSIPLQQQASYTCYGIRVQNVQAYSMYYKVVIIQDIKLWRGIDCKSECVHGTCKNGIYDYICDCEPGYEGEMCDKDIDDCESHKCVHGTCKDGVNHYTCDCQPRYEGEMCDRDYFDELMDKAPENVIKIVYEGNNVLDEKSQGKENTPTQVRYQPLSITMPKTKDGLFYTLIMIDPDTPSRDTPIKNKTQVLHWLMVNIPGHGFGGRHLAPYIGSGPPQETGIHRYTFLIFEEGNTPKDYKGIAPFDPVEVARRVYWNFVEDGKPWTLRGFMNWAKLGEPVAANFYQAQYANADVDVDDNL